MSIHSSGSGRGGGEGDREGSDADEAGEDLAASLNSIMVEEEPGSGSRLRAKSLGITGDTEGAGSAREYSFRSVAEELGEGLLQISSQEADDTLVVRVEAASDPRSDSSLPLGVMPLLLLLRLPSSEG